MQSEFEGWMKTRPLRIAFLVDLENEHLQLALDGIIADCYDRWGGRFSLIVPCNGARIVDAYWRWLEAYDPDIVYSYVELDRDAILELHARLNPAEVGFHRFSGEPRLDVYGFKPEYGVAPLASLSMLFWLARFRRGDAQSNLRIIDSWQSEKPTRLLSDNFGAYSISRSTGMFPADARGAGQLLSVVSPDKQKNLPADLLFVSSELEALNEYVRGKAVSLSQLSILGASKIDIDHGDWSRTFNLVIGEAPSDRILFWNVRLLLPKWLDQDIYCLRVRIEDLRKPEFAAAIDQLLKQRNHVGAGSGGPYQIKVRSTSESAEVLDEAVEIIRALKPWSQLSKQSTDLTSVVPSAGSLDQAVKIAGYDSGDVGRHAWSRFNWNDATVKPPIEAPQHLKDAPARQAFTVGHWALDLILEYDGPGPRLGSGNQWSIPREWRIAGAFEVSYRNDGGYRHVFKNRRNRAGNLSLPVSVDNSIDRLSIPSAEDAIRHAFISDGWRAAQLEASTKIVMPPNKVDGMRPSNEARYLAGVLGMTTGLRRASSYLLHPFLRDMFAKLGGTPSLDAAKVQPTIDRLRKSARTHPTFNIRDDHDRGAIGDMIVKAANNLKRSMRFVDLQELKKDWAAYRASYWDKVGKTSLGTEDDLDYDRFEEATLASCLVGMRKRKILFQGHKWTCPECHHRNWIDLSKLSPEMQCEVCNRVEQAPVEIDWLFRPNEFLIESLRDHSVLSLVWTLDALASRARYSFIYAGPTAFFFTPQGRSPDAEADLLVVVDGQSILCEVKSSWTTLRRVEIVNFVELAKRLRPDVALLAVMENEQSHVAKTKHIEDELRAVGIKFELLMPGPETSHDGPILPYDEA